MARTRMGVGLGVLVAAAIAASPASAAQNDFRVELEGGQATPEYAECFVGGKILTCALYNRPTEAQCDFGGAVSTLTLTRAGKLRRGSVCADEGSHDQRHLRPGRTFRAGGFTCTVIDGDVQELRCLPRPARG